MNKQINVHNIAIQHVYADLCLQLVPIPVCPFDSFRSVSLAAELVWWRRVRHVLLGVKLVQRVRDTVHSICIPK